jgi:hypothetical protein
MTKLNLSLSNSNLPLVELVETLSKSCCENIAEKIKRQGITIRICKMKKLFLILLLISTNSFANTGECYHQRNPMGYANYDICEVKGTGYICVTIEGKSNAGISCFPAQKTPELPAKNETPNNKKRNADFSHDTNS